MAVVARVAMGVVDVVSIGLDGTAVLVDGRQVKLVVNGQGALGCRKLERAAGPDLSVDQASPSKPWTPPTPEQMGIDQA